MNTNKDKIALLGAAQFNWKEKIARIWKKWRQFFGWHRHRRVLWPY